MNTKKQRTLFPDNLKTIRHFYKMDCSEFGKLIGVDGKRLAEVERDRLLPTDVEINAVLKELHPMIKEVLLNNIMGLHLQTFSMTESGDVPCSCDRNLKKCKHPDLCVSDKL